MAYNHEVATSIPKLHKYIDEGDYSSIIIMNQPYCINLPLKIKQIQGVYDLAGMQNEMKWIGL